MSRWSLLVGWFVVFLGLMSTMRAVAKEPPKLIPVDAEVIVQREKSLAKDAPEGAKLVAYLDCGSQMESTTSEEVKITWAPAATPGNKVYKFPSEAEEVLPTQPTVFYDGGEVAFKISGLDRKKRYLAGLTWWDYDDGNRTQSVVVGSPNGRLVRLAVSAIRLPNYTTDKQLPAERRFRLPATFARNGEMQLRVRRDTRANTVISELWIWQLN